MPVDNYYKNNEVIAKYGDPGHPGHYAYEHPEDCNCINCPERCRDDDCTNELTSDDVDFCLSCCKEMETNHG